jgi:hypothetical protein
MAMGEKSWIVFKEDYVKSMNYEFIFNEYYTNPYTKSIMNRLKELYKEPEFKCTCEQIYRSPRATNGYSPTINYYIVRVEWDYKNDVKNDCECIII